MNKSVLAAGIMAGPSSFVTVGADAEIGDRQRNLVGQDTSARTAVGVEFVIPFGAPSQRRSVAEASRVGLFFGQQDQGFAPDGTPRRSNAWGQTFDGRSYARIQNDVYSLTEASRRFGLEGDEANTDNSNNKTGVILLIIGGSIALASTALWEAEEDASNFTEDLFNCIAGNPDCPADDGG